MLKSFFVVPFAVVLGCSSGPDDAEEPFTDCAIGELTGAWRFRYAETDGNCGALADETVILEPDGDPPDGCDLESVEISDDQCRMDQAFSCPLNDGQGEQSWVLVLKQMASEHLEGSGTLQASHPILGSCRSTYDITASRL